MTRLAHHVPEQVQDERLWPLAMELGRDASEAIVAFNAPMMNAWRRKEYTFVIMAAGDEPVREYSEWRVSHLRVEPTQQLLKTLEQLLPLIGMNRLSFANPRLVLDAPSPMCAYDILIQGVERIHT